MTEAATISDDQSHDVPPFPQTELRPPAQVMRLGWMGSFFPTRLSFLRSLLRDLAADGSKVERIVWDIDEHGFGNAAYAVTLNDCVYTLICYTSPLDDADRTDRVIAEAWDACFVLFDGRPDAENIAALRAQAVRQEAGRYNEKVLVLSRANKSVRLFEHVVENLARGEQPNADQVAQTGYLMRTTAVYGNGKFGLADRADVIRRSGVTEPFRLELLTVYLIRDFTLDLVDHIARAKGGGAAVELFDEASRRLGIGNSTGLGMAPFLVSHPILINNWILVRETALARVRALEIATKQTSEQFCGLCKQADRHLAGWNVDDEPEQRRIENLRDEWRGFAVDAVKLLERTSPWDAVIRRSEQGSVDLQELAISLVLEPHGDLVDGLCDCMAADGDFVFDPAMGLSQFRALIEDIYGWALATDLDREGADGMVWYVSEDKLEPRFGERSPDRPGYQEMPHAIVRMVHRLSSDLGEWDGDKFLAQFLAHHPEHRFVAQRVQLVAKHPYAEIRDNLVDTSLRPIDLLRCKLSFFGASRFDPRSDRWTRITLFQGAPRLEDLTQDNAADCFLPAFQ